MFGRDVRKPSQIIVNTMTTTLLPYPNPSFNGLIMEKYCHTKMFWELYLITFTYYPKKQKTKKNTTRVHHAIAKL